MALLKYASSEFLSARSTGVWGLPGEPVLPKGADEQWAWPASFAPRQKIKAGHSRASTSCEVSFVLQSANWRKKNKSKRPSCTRHDSFFIQLKK